MKRFFRSFMLTAVAAMGIVACSEGGVDEPILEPTSGITLTASVSATTETKVSFTDNTETIDLAWESDDSFTLYDESGDYVGDFTCSDADSGTFGNDYITLNDGESYTAIFPATTALTLDEALAEDLTSTQNGDYISDLNDACMMKATFTYNVSGSNKIQFEHLKAIMTIIFTSEHRVNGLEKLIFANGDDEYTVTYDHMLETTTSYIMIEPCDGTSRNLYFYLTDFVDSTLRHYAVDDVTKAYEAGYRYTADLSTLK